jgi:hypothetical protein
LQTLRQGNIRCRNHLLWRVGQGFAPFNQRALEGLCEDLNTIGATYPGTDIPLNYKVAVHKIRAAA